MKARTLLVSAMMLTMTMGTLDAAAGELGNPAKRLASMNRQQVEVAKTRYLSCLASDNEGLVQSALGIVLQWRLMMPQEDFSAIEAKVNDLAENGETPGIRFRASLASLVMENQGSFNINAGACDTCDELFQAVTQSLRKAAIGEKVR